MKVLIIGLGSIGKKHAAALQTIDKTVAVFALRSGENPDEMPGITNLSSLDGIPADLDFVIVSNSTKLHGQTIRQMIGLGHPLFIEKPVLSDLSEAADLTKRLANSGITTYVACNLRFHPAVRFMKDYFASEKPQINEVNIYCGSYLPDWRPNRDFRTVYSANKAMGGGAHLDLIHELDYCTWFFGTPTAVQSSKRHRSSLEIDAVDSAIFLMEYEDFTATVNLNYYRRDAKRQIEVLTSETTLLVDLLANTVVDLNTNELLHQGDFNVLATYEDQLAYFIECLERGKVPMNDFDNAVEVLKLAQA